MIFERGRALGFRFADDPRVVDLAPALGRPPIALVMSDCQNLIPRINIIIRQMPRDICRMPGISFPAG